MKISIKKLAGGMLTAVAVSMSGFAIPIGASKCFPIQHLCNVIAGVFLGTGLRGGHGICHVSGPKSAGYREPSGVSGKHGRSVSLRRGYISRPASSRRPTWGRCSAPGFWAGSSVIRLRPYDGKGSCGVCLCSPVPCEYGMRDRDRGDPDRSPGPLRRDALCERTAGGGEPVNGRREERSYDSGK